MQAPPRFKFTKITAYPSGATVFVDQTVPLTIQNSSIIPRPLYKVTNYHQFSLLYPHAVLIKAQMGETWAFCNKTML